MTADTNGWADEREAERETLDAWESRPSLVMESRARIAREADRMRRSYQRLVESRRIIR